MLKLSVANWDAIRAEETRLLRSISPQEGARQFFALLAEFAPWLHETESIYRNQRNQALIQLQARLARLNNHRDHERTD
ncbi:MAG: hypothetical protein FJZ86_05710 [Chloroflexi bacterium]|nr:hypothetical protein [Chloroflexota bacterium]